MAKSIFTKDLAQKKMFITREFNGGLEQVWQAWTTSDILDQWWAPRPWKAITKTMDFSDGGHWLYCMQGPNGEQHWAKAHYSNIVALKSYEVFDAFCDADGNNETDLPNMNWKIAFKPSTNGTIVDININFTSKENLEKIVAMGFEQGFTAAHENLDQYLQAQFNLWIQQKPEKGSRVSTYLNFPGNTEEAFIFYKSVFGGEFGGKGIQHFGDIPAEAGHPPIADEVKKMVLHVELPILGGHILMATDAPKEMGFNLTTGNNMHICLEPETRAETKRLFDALSEGGNITMQLMDMFFGSYFGECTDKYGINWMFNCAEKE